MVETSPAAATGRRWLQFRLRTLLMAPVFILLLQVFSDQLFDHLMALWCAYGALFGAAWAIGQMRIVGLRRTGLVRVLPVAKAAINGGMLGGALMGAPVFWTALWRSGAWRYFNMRGCASDAWEILTSGIAGYWCGGFAGALAGGAAGTVAAYLVCFMAKAISADGWFQGLAYDETGTNFVAKPAGGWRVCCRKALAISLAIGPPVWVGTCLWGDWTEREVIDRLRAKGLKSHHRRAYGPQWFEHAIAPGYELSWFRRGGEVTYGGHIDSRAFDDLLALRKLQAIHLEVRTEADLISAAKLLRRRPHVAASIASYGELNLTWDRRTGAFQFWGLVSPQTFDEFVQLAELQDFNFHFETDADLIVAADFLRRRDDVQASISLYGSRITDQGLASLEGLTNLEQLQLHGTSITDPSVAIVVSLLNLDCLTAQGNSQLSKRGETRLYSAAPAAVVSRNNSIYVRRSPVQRFNDSSKD